MHNRLIITVFELKKLPSQEGILQSKIKKKNKEEEGILQNILILTIPN